MPLRPLPLVRLYGSTLAVVGDSDGDGLVRVAELNPGPGGVRVLADVRQQFRDGEVDRGFHRPFGPGRKGATDGDRHRGIEREGADRVG